MIRYIILAVTLINVNISSVAAQQKRDMGIFVHYLCNLQNDGEQWSQGKHTSWDECVNDFNVDIFAKQVKQTGASYVIFTTQQRSKYLCLPNSFYENLTGYKRGDATCHRDLISDLYTALHKRGIKLFLYVTGDGPRDDKQASEALNGNRTQGKDGSFSVDAEWVNNWSAVLRSISMQYGTKISGWWADGCYPFIGYTPAFLGQIYAALRSGNRESLIALNAGASDQVDKSAIGTLAAGESNNFGDIPKSKLVNPKQKWHILSYLGKNWAQPGVRYTPSFLSKYIKQVNSKNGMISIDVKVLRDGSIDKEQLKTLISLNSLK